MIRFWEIMPGALAWLYSFRSHISFLARARRRGRFHPSLRSLLVFKANLSLFHLRSSFTKMNANLKMDWLAKLKKIIRKIGRKSATW